MGLQHRFFASGDFGSLHQIEFNSSRIGLTVDFWSSGKLGIHLVNYKEGEELINVLLEAEEEVKKKEILKKIELIIKENTEI